MNLLVLASWAGLSLTAAAAAQGPNNEAVVRRLFDEVWSQGKLEAAHQIVAPSYQFHSPSMRIVGPTGPDLATSMVENRREAFPDLKLVVEDLFSTGNRVAVRWVAEGTHNGPLGQAKPTGKKISYEGMSIFEVTGGKIYQEWTLDDFRSVLRQLGIDRLEMRR